MLPDTDKLYFPLKAHKYKCITEMQIIKLCEEIRNKSNWQLKIKDPVIVKKWKAEAKEQGLCEEAINYVINKVKYLAKICKDGIELGPVDAIWQADGLVDKDLRMELKNYIKNNLERLPKDFHPGSNDLVVDLVHPSLYCYVQKKSLLINDNNVYREFTDECGGEKIHQAKYRYPVVLPSGIYRWLPAEVSVSKNGKVSFESYINNLNPKKHSKLYDIIGEVFSKFIPLFNRTLFDTANYEDCIIDLRRFYWYYDKNLQTEDDFDTKEKYCEYLDSIKFKPLPIPKFVTPKGYNKVDLKGRKLQVIVKLANIELTPEKPFYSGGSWHVEGIEEERIVATGIYYYDIENITESNLNFRVRVDDPEYRQYDEYGVLKIYGAKDGDKLNQILGRVNTVQDRLLVFPNFYQHCVSSFQLTDPSKPGYRKIIAFFLVDPNVKIISTENVLPQQAEWTEFDIYKDRNVMTRSEAEEYREKLMTERKLGVDEYNKKLFEWEFSLCEH